MNRISINAPEYQRFKEAKEKFSAQSSFIQKESKRYKKLSNPTNREWLENLKRKDEYSKQCKEYDREHGIFIRWVNSLYGVKNLPMDENWLDQPHNQESDGKSFFDGLAEHYNSEEHKAADAAREMVKLHIDIEKKLNVEQAAQAEQDSKYSNDPEVQALLAKLKKDSSMLKNQERNNINPETPEGPEERK